MGTQFGSEVETVRVSSALYALLADPSSMPKDQPYCMWCNNPKTKEDRNRKCELCNQVGTVIGRRGPTKNVYVELFTRPRRIRIVRRK